MKSSRKNEVLKNSEYERFPIPTGCKPSKKAKIERMEANCRRCGRRLYAGKGLYTTWHDKYPTPQFFCNQCIKAMEKEERDEKERKILQIAKEVKELPRDQRDTTPRERRAISSRKSTGGRKLL